MKVVQLLLQGFCAINNRVRQTFSQSKNPLSLQRPTVVMRFYAYASPRVVLTGVSTSECEPIDKPIHKIE